MASLSSPVPTPSPFRYPGGKSWFIPYVRQWVASLPAPVHFAEPFAGGANVGLALALEDLVEHVTLVELDKNVASVWEAILNGQSKALGERVTKFRMSKTAVMRLLRSSPRTPLTRAFVTIVKNRVRRAGILSSTASLLKLGENGNGVHSRWYPQTLKDRIDAIAAKSSKITFLCDDGLTFVKEHAPCKNFAFFIDPPYTVAGERLYAHSEIDHEELFKAAASIAGNVIMTYDNSREARSFARQWGFQTRRIRMRTSHHSEKMELLIARDFRWLNRRAVSGRK